MKKEYYIFIGLLIGATILLIKNKKQLNASIEAISPKIDPIAPKIDLAEIK